MELNSFQVRQLLSSDLLKSKMYEFVLWSNCCNNCKFCWLKYLQNPISTITQKIEAINLVDLKLKEIQNFSDILLVGGEIFEDSRTARNFIGLTYKICQKIIRGEIRYFYINTNLLYEDISFLIEFLDVFEKYDLFDRLKFTTSWDLVGRFRDNLAEELWERNIKLIKSNYPRLNIVTNLILTKSLCSAIINNKFDVVNFEKEFSAVNLIPYIPVPKDIFDEQPGKEITLNAIKKSNIDIQKYINSFDLKQTKIVYDCSNSQLTDITESDLPCGHNKNFTRVWEDNSCFICQLKKFFKE